MSSPAPRPPSPPRPPRTTGALVTSMVVTLAAVVGFIVFRGAFRETPRIEPDPVDYLEVVALAQQADLRVAHPLELPPGWFATSADLGPAAGGVVWGLGLLTDERRFAGVRQEDEDLDDLLATYVDEAAVQGDDVTLGGALGGTWTTWSDEGGDHALATEVVDGTEEQVVLVYGSAPEEQLRGLAESLVVD